MADAVIVEATECLASVPMNDGNIMCLLKFNGENITTNLLPSRGRLERGKCYRATFEEIPCPSER